MNERDSETFAGMLEEKGYVYTDDKKAADVVVMNTCSVRDNADKRFFGVLGQLKHSKEENPEKVVALCGCMMQQEHIQKTIRQKYPWVDIIFGTHNIANFPVLLDGALAGKKHQVEIWQNGGDIVEGLPAARMYPFKSFVNIMYGCNNFCTYCIVPYTRGRERSRHPEEIIRECRQLAESGTKEITLLGQNVNSYGRAKFNETSYCAKDDEPHIDFAGLLREIDKIPGIERIRFMTSHPKDLSDDLIACYGDLKHLCKVIHLPVQSGSNDVLKRMNRVYTREQYLELVKKLRNVCPDIGISTDLIVGFPGETDLDFEDTLDLVKQVRYDSAFTFIYSVRKGTPAETMENHVPQEVQHQRFDRLMNALHEIQEEQSREYQDKIIDVLVEGPSKTNEEVLTGRDEKNKTVDFKGEPSLIGQIVPVRITKAQTFSLYGELVK